MMKRVIGLFLILLVITGIAFAQEEKRPLFLKIKEEGAGTTALTEPRYSMRTFKLKYSDAAEVKAALFELLAAGEGVSVNKKLNTIVVRASDENLAKLGKIIVQMDQAPAQVQVEAKMIELKTGNGDASNPTSLGVSIKKKGTDTTSPASDFNYAQFFSTSAPTAAATAAGLYAHALSGNVEAFLSALEKTIGYDLVASPWITALNHEEAVITIGEQILYAAETTISTTGQITQSNKFIDVGTILKFTPHINEDGYVLMDINPVISTGNPTTGINKTETKNRVIVKDGQSIVIGGLTRKYNTETEWGVPILSKIPFIGVLFRKTDVISEKRDIMVVITPYILTPGMIDKMAERSKNWEKSAGDKNPIQRLIH